MAEWWFGLPVAAIINIGLAVALLRVGAGSERRVITVYAVFGLGLHLLGKASLEFMRAEALDPGRYIIVPFATSTVLAANIFHQLGTACWGASCIYWVWTKNKKSVTENMIGFRNDYITFSVLSLAIFGVFQVFATTLVLSGPVGLSDFPFVNIAIGELGWLGASAPGLLALLAVAMAFAIKRSKIRNSNT